MKRGQFRDALKEMKIKLCRRLDKRPSWTLFLPEINNKRPEETVGLQYFRNGDEASVVGGDGQQMG